MEMEALAREALSRYALTGARLEMIRHNENYTCRVDAREGLFLLRVHAPREGFSLDVLRPGVEAGAYVAGEMALLGSGLPFQQPVPARAGGMVAELTGGVRATLLTWIEGETLEAGGADEEKLFETGRAVGLLHEHTRGRAPWRRYAYDQALLARLLARIERAERFPDDQLAVMRSAIRAIGREMDASRERVLAHADLSGGNLVWTGGRVAPIDFSLSGYAPPALDAGSVFAAYEDKALREAYLDGYERETGAKIAGPSARVYLALLVLMFVGCQYERADGWDWFPGAMKRWCEGVLRLS